MSQIAQAWGCSRQNISKWVKKGMPTTSLAAASSWRMAHGSRSARVKLLPQLPPAPAAVGDDVDPAALVDGESPEAVRDRARKAERTSYAMLQENLRTKDFDAITASLKAYTASQTLRSGAEIAFIKHHQLAGTLVDRSAALGSISRKLDPIKNLIMSLPEAMAKRCNPTDPETAAAALSEWAHSTLRSVQES